MNKGQTPKIYSPQQRAAAVILGNKIGTAAAANQLGIHKQNIFRWRAACGSLKQWFYTPEEKSQILAAVADVGLKAACKQFNACYDTVVLWHRASIEALPALTKEGILQFAKARGLLETSVHFRVSLAAITLLVKKLPIEERIHYRHHSTELLQEALDRAQEIGLAKAAKEFEVTKYRLSTYARERGFRIADKLKMLDSSFRWLVVKYQNLSAWRELASNWMSQQTSAFKSKIESLNLFFSKYISVLDIGPNPSDFLARANRVPDFYSTSCPQTGAGVTTASQVHAFIAWVLLQESYCVRDDFDRMALSPAFHNPIKVISRKGLPRPEESVYSPIPYGYIDELRRVLAEGSTYSDWRWAQSALGGIEGKPGNVAPDWFEVPKEAIDLNDPDCVWRVRKRSMKGGGPVQEMWSPVRWTALLIKLLLPLRTVQVRLLDSGEADWWRYESTDDGQGCWKTNHSILREGTERKPLARGVFRRVLPKQFDRPSNQQLAGPQIILFINTNKTADIAKSANNKGYLVPWNCGGPIHSDPYYWLAKLRNWQEKFNAVSRRTSWQELSARHMVLKSDVELASFADACFLFRLPEGNVNETHLPISVSALDLPWFSLLSCYEGRLAARGETHSDGSRVRFIKSRPERTTYFPLHSLRVSLITALALEGRVSFPILQKLVGHSRLLMTLYYTKPGQSRMIAALEEARQRMDAEKESSIIHFLSTANYEQLIQDAIANNQQSVRAAIPVHLTARNPAGWMPMHHGCCLAGGNTSPAEGQKTRGCFNGGDNIGSEREPTYNPVSGGSFNCVRCRWFVTEPHYIPALVAHFNNIIYHFDEARNSCLSSESSLETLKIERLESERNGKRFSRAVELKQASRVWEISMNRFNDFAEDAAATAKLIERCEEKLNSSDVQNKTRTLISTGELGEIKTLIEEIGSELLQLTGVCRDLEIYPDLSGGKAVFRRSQILDAALGREGIHPIFMTLSESEQLLAGNAFMRSLADQVLPANVISGETKIIGLIDGCKKLADSLGIDISDLLIQQKLNVKKITSIRLLERGR